MSGAQGAGDCHEIFARLSEYVDDELPEDFCRRIEAHMGDCPPCVTFLESLRRTVRLVADSAPVRSSEDVRREVKRAIRELRERRRE